jgi:hypothetical protein
MLLTRGVVDTCRHTSVPPWLGNRRDLRHVNQPLPLRARAGVTGHNVRYVLIFCLITVIVAFAIVSRLFSLNGMQRLLRDNSRFIQSGTTLA